MRPYFTLVSTILNEKNRIEDTIADIEKQTIHPNEIIITDACSTDGTFERLHTWKAASTIPIIVLQKLKCGAAEGRNMAIKAAKHELIVSTDFGCLYNATWLEELTAPFQNPDVKVVGGAYGIKEDDLKTVAEKAAYIMFNGFKLNVNDPRFIPSSRSIAYYKSVWEDVGGYNEWLTLTADDFIFGHLILEKGYKIYPSESCNVYWGRHKTRMGYAKEAYRYGIGEGETMVNGRNVISNFIEMLMRYFFVITFFTLITIKIIAPDAIGIYHFIMLIPLLFGFRSYYKYFKSWLSMRSEKYNLATLWEGFQMMELMRIYSIKGWLKGYKRAKADTTGAVAKMRNEIKSFQFK